MKVFAVLGLLTFVANVVIACDVTRLMACSVRLGGGMMEAERSGDMETSCKHAADLADCVKGTMNNDHCPMSKLLPLRQRFTACNIDTSWMPNTMTLLRNPLKPSPDSMPESMSVGMILMKSLMSGQMKLDPLVMGHCDMRPIQACGETLMKNEAQMNHGGNPPSQDAIQNKCRECNEFVQCIDPALKKCRELVPLFKMVMKPYMKAPYNCPVSFGDIDTPEHCDYTTLNQCFENMVNQKKSLMPLQYTDKQKYIDGKCRMGKSLVSCTMRSMQSCPHFVPLMMTGIKSFNDDPYKCNIMMDGLWSPEDMNMGAMWMHDMAVQPRRGKKGCKPRPPPPGGRPDMGPDGKPHVGPDGKPRPPPPGGKHEMGPGRKPEHGPDGKPRPPPPGGKPNMGPGGKPEHGPDGKPKPPPPGGRPDMGPGGKPEHGPDGKPRRPPPGEGPHMGPGGKPEHGPDGKPRRPPPGEGPHMGPGGKPEHGPDGKPRRPPPGEGPHMGPGGKPEHGPDGKPRRPPPGQGPHMGPGEKPEHGPDGKPRRPPPGEGPHMGPGGKPEHGPDGKPRPPPPGGRPDMGPGRKPEHGPDGKPRPPPPGGKPDMGPGRKPERGPDGKPRPPPPDCPPHMEPEGKPERGPGKKPPKMPHCDFEGMKKCVLEMMKGKNTLPYDTKSPDYFKQKCQLNTNLVSCGKPILDNCPEIVPLMKMAMQPYMEAPYNCDISFGLADTTTHCDYENIKKCHTSMTSDMMMLMKTKEPNSDSFLTEKCGHAETFADCIKDTVKECPQLAPAMGMGLKKMNNMPYNCNVTFHHKPKQTDDWSDNDVCTKKMQGCTNDLNMAMKKSKGKEGVKGDPRMNMADRCSSAHKYAKCVRPVMESCEQHKDRLQDNVDRFNRHPYNCKIPVYGASSAISASIMTMFSALLVLVTKLSV